MRQDKEQQLLPHVGTNSTSKLGHFLTEGPRQHNWVLLVLITASIYPSCPTHGRPKPQNIYFAIVLALARIWA